MARWPPRTATRPRRAASIEPRARAIVAVVADSAAPELEVPVATRVRGPAGRFVAARLFDGARACSARIRARPSRRASSACSRRVPLLLIHGEADTTVPIADGRRLAALAGPAAEHWVVPGADHSGGHAVAPR